MKNLILTLLITAVTISGLQSCSSSKGENALDNNAIAIPSILDRTFTVGDDIEREQLLTTYDNALIALNQNPENLNVYITLAQVFIAEARYTGNNGYYHDAAIRMTDKIIQSGTQNNDLLFQALTLKSGVLLSMHQFSKAYETANKAFAISEHNAQLLGALVDAHVELGNYSDAVATSDKMINLRPDIRSYSRVSYLRQIYGDNAGAIEAMKMAVESGATGTETTEWARIILGDLYLMTGDLQSAELNYRLALEYRQNYPFAYAALGRLEKVKGNYEAAIHQTENAIRIQSDVSFISQLADLYELSGNIKKAQKIREDVVELLEESEKEQNSENASVKHNGARELATAYMKAGELEKAYTFATKDHAMRPANIDANELMAWICYLMGDNSNARLYADNMLATHTKNPSTLYKAGLIYIQSGDTDKGNELIAVATSINPQIDPLIKNLSK